MDLKAIKDELQGLTTSKDCTSTTLEILMKQSFPGEFSERVSQLKQYHMAVLRTLENRIAELQKNLGSAIDATSPSSAPEMKSASNG